MDFQLTELPIAQLLLDPNNYRFLDLPDWRPRQRNRFHDQSVQDSTLRLLTRTTRYNLAELRSSIMTNSYVPLERIVVVEYEFSPNLYLIVEGNRRVAALRSLLNDHGDGSITLSAQQKVAFQTVPVAILDPGPEGFKGAERVIMGIRHIAGPQEWGAYQQAHLILELVDDEGQKIEDIARHLGLSNLETRRRYRAIRALKAMESDELYAAVAKPEHYRLFHELVAQPEVRSFFQWDHENAKFRDAEQARQFFELIQPIQSESAPKLRTYSDVRQLREVVQNQASIASLLDADQSFSTALAVARSRSEVAGSQVPQLSIEIRRFQKVMEETQVEALTALTPSDILALEAVASLISSRVEQYNRLMVQ